MSKEVFDVRIPEEFKQFVALLDDYTMPTPFDERGWISHSVRLKDVQTCHVIAAFLRSVLGKDLSGSDLRAIWDAGSPMFMFETDEQLRAFLTLMLEQLEERGRRG